jgi:hypothetical protein
MGNNIMMYAIFIKAFDIFKEYIIRAESTIFHESVHVIVKKDYSRMFILLGLLISTILFWLFPQGDAIRYSVFAMIVGDSILLYFKIRMWNSIK